MERRLLHLAPRLHVAPKLGEPCERSFVVRQRSGGNLMKGFEPERYAGAPPSVIGEGVELAPEQPRNIDRHVRKITQVRIARSKGGGESADVRHDLTVPTNAFASPA